MALFLRIGKFPSKFQDHMSVLEEIERLSNFIGFNFHGMQMQLYIML
jgi:hypothetical protein